MTNLRNGKFDAMNSDTDVVFELLKLEDHTELQRFRFSTDGIHMWPFIRIATLLTCRDQVFELKYNKFVNPPLNTPTERKRLLEDTTIEQIYEEVDSLVPVQTIVFTNASNSAEINGVKRNKYSYPFEETVDNFLLVEDSPTGQISRHTENLFWHEKMFHLARLQAKDVAISQFDASNIEEMILYLQSVYGDLCNPDFLKRIKNQLTTLATRLPFWKQFYFRLLEKTKPKFVVIDNASYGHRAGLIFWLKQMNIPVLELQHGAINEGTPAYRHRGLPVTQWFQSYLPDKVLFWGEFWLDKYQAELDKVAVGNPFFLESTKGFKRTKEHVLVCIVGFNPDITLPIIHGLAERFPEHRFKLRLHPIIRKNWQYWIDRLPDNCFFCQNSINSSLYEDLSKSSLVLSEPSTVIFEASQLGIPTYLMQTSNWQYPVPMAEQLFNDLQLPTELQLEINREYYFGDDWRSAFLKHLSPLCQ